MHTLVEAQRERLPIAMQRAQEKLKKIEPNPDAQRLVNIARTVKTATQRVMWLQQAASAWSKPLLPVAACKKGCDHCCHLPVFITQTEAQLIGKAIEQTPMVPTKFVRLEELGTDEQTWLEAETKLRASVAKGPCPFLKMNVCQIHSRRPMVCRLLINLDNDALLCRTIEDVDVLVPYANSMALKARYIAFQPSGVLADIREFFAPAERRKIHAEKSAGA